MSQRTQIRKDLAQIARLAERVEREVVDYTNGKLDLVGVHEASEILGVAPNYVSKMRERGKLPEPIVVLRSGAVWHRSDIEAVER
jgi:hypothetical protein